MRESAIVARDVHVGPFVVRPHRAPTHAEQQHAFLTTFLNRDTKSSMNGVTATAISVKSQLSQNMMNNIATIVNISTAMPSVDDDAKAWIVCTSDVMVLRIVPV